MKKLSNAKSRNAGKKFDAVKMMRDIRDKLTKRYLKNPGLEISDLQKIRRKYKIKSNVKPHFA